VLPAESNPLAPFSLRGQLPQIAHLPFRPLVEGLLERGLALDYLNRLYQQRPLDLDCDRFLAYTLDRLGCRYRLVRGDVAAIPASGPVVVVANHPFGAIEGVILAELLRRRRSDVKLMANYLLQRIPEIGHLFIGVDPFAGAGAVQRNMAPMKQALRHLQEGGLLVVFPAGEVAHLDFARGGVVDPPWSASIARLIRRSGASVLPLHIGGKNSPLFQVAGLFNAQLRTAMLPRELVAVKGREVTLAIGDLQTAERMGQFADDTAAIAYLRFRTYLAGRVSSLISPVTERQIKRSPKPLIAAVDPALLAAEVAALPAKALVAEGGEMRVYYAREWRIPQLLREIGRLRELTFRGHGEGSGEACDLDEFDRHYTHLFIWHTARQEVVGAYRLARVDKVLLHHGKQGLYTRTLFKYGKRFLKQLGPAIELGRSFVRSEYQRSYQPLLLLWKGIGGYLVQHPQYRRLFGPVSISADYQPLSQQMMVEFLRQSVGDSEMARLVKPRSPFREERSRLWRLEGGADHCRDLEDLGELLTALEQDGKGVPILLRQYLKMGGRIVGFNVDADFANVLDALIVVDLTRSDAKLLGRYMGSEEAAAWLALHGVTAGG
jgi:putative hemolysin